MINLVIETKKCHRSQVLTILYSTFYEFKFIIWNWKIIRNPIFYQYRSFQSDVMKYAVFMSISNTIQCSHSILSIQNKLRNIAKIMRMMMNICFGSSLKTITVWGLVWTSAVSVVNSSPQNLSCHKYYSFNFNGSKFFIGDVRLFKPRCYSKHKIIFLFYLDIFSQRVKRWWFCVLGK